MKNKDFNFGILTLILLMMLVNNLSGLHTFKTVFNGFAITMLVFVGYDYIYKHKTKSKDIA